MTTKPNTLFVVVQNGKYTVIQNADGDLYALRYNHPWRSLTGDSLVYCLAAEVQDLRDENEELRRRLDQTKVAIDQSEDAGDLGDTLREKLRYVLTK